MKLYYVNLFVSTKYKAKHIVGLLFKYGIFGSRSKKLEIHIANFLSGPMNEQNMNNTSNIINKTVVIY